MAKPASDRRAIILIIDGCGIGAAPDAASFGDSQDCNSLGNTAKAVGGLKLPVLEKLGLSNISPVEGVTAQSQPWGLHGKLKELSCGKDTLTGHWEMMGVISTCGFRTYPEGFPDEVIAQFIKETGCKGVLCNKPASGTAILQELGEEHQRTGFPIVYTSGDSVFQIACHADTIPLARLYEWCEIARRMLQGEHKVGRVIARPFNGEPGNYRRMSFERRDYGVSPPEKTLLDGLLAQHMGVLGIGKIDDIFNRNGVSHAQHTGTNKEGLELTKQAINGTYQYKGREIMEDAPAAAKLIFTNLVDTDALYGHRRNVDGYAAALTEIDHHLGEIIEIMREDDLLLITSDHGNDPTAPGTDHTREFVPLLGYAKSLHNRSGRALNIGVREGFYDIAGSVAHWLGVPWSGGGKSFITEALEVVS